MSHDGSQMHIEQLECRISGVDFNKSCNIWVHALVYFWPERFVFHYRYYNFFVGLSHQGKNLYAFEDDSGSECPSISHLSCIPGCVNMVLCY